ncbi:MAG: hypothetical protein JJ953_05785 [Gracilimonas sp.]|uniref:hypothetical protein n=1 Tax=Gracilimonas sediminicola TaxID=2952158 RepID=UPI001B236C7E|nr:hypothetical protein [Gracilimonas sp.]MBO6616592.1 hypothetical protein [Gracilimonas sp.]
MNFFRLTKDFKKYRITATALLMVLGIHVVMPVAVLAAGYCNAESNAPADTEILIEDCCDLKRNSAADRDQDIVGNCTFERFCNSLPAHSFGEHKSLLPSKKQSNPLPAISGFVHTLYSVDKNRETFSHTSLDTLLLYPGPPVFLLNSTFLK